MVSRNQTEAPQAWELLGWVVSRQLFLSTILLPYWVRCKVYLLSSFTNKNMDFQLICYKMDICFTKMFILKMILQFSLNKELPLFIEDPAVKLLIHSVASEIRARGSETSLSGFTSRAATVTLGHSITFWCLSVFVLKMEIILELDPRAAVRMEWNNIHTWGRIMPGIWFMIREHQVTYVLTG